MSTDEGSFGATSEHWPANYGLIELDETDSTMAEVRRRAGGLAGPTWIVARRQTSGRGRRGRPWLHPEGNLAATLFLPRPGSALVASHRSFTTALALRSALQSYAVETALEVKWPNDVLLGGGKVAGILLESSGMGPELDWLAIGIGVNLVAAPPVEELEEGAVPPVSLFTQIGARVVPERLLRQLAVNFDYWEEQLRTYGFDSIRLAWLRHAARLGQPITARTARDTQRGIFETVDETGNLVLNTPEGLRRIAAADVYFD